QTESDISIGAETALQIAKEGNYVATPLSVTLTRIDGKKIWQVSGVKNLALSHVFVDASTGAIIATE
ncbi:MAG: PepSY domain-containing protein, partial [bacterium]|nr:PepSY domain-containing protein [bacterium]